MKPNTNIDLPVPATKGRDPTLTGTLDADAEDPCACEDDDGAAVDEDEVEKDENMGWILVVFVLADWINLPPWAPGFSVLCGIFFFVGPLPSTLGFSRTISGISISLKYI